jgi:hypothetical protein
MRGIEMTRIAMMMLVLAATGTAVAQGTMAEQDKHVRVNEVQVIGSHNSYHTGFAPSEKKWMEAHASKALHSLDYGHAPLGDQLTGGVRQIEIDVFADAKGGRYAHPKITDRVAQDGLPKDAELDPNHELDKPGFKVMHMQDIDQRSVCHTFVVCLTQVRAWSKAHPQHLPLFLLIETKEGEMKEMPEAVKTEPFTKEVFDRLDAEILSVFKKSEIVTPDDVRGSSATLNEAVTKKGWPTLAKARGKVIFLMDQRKVESIYTDGHPSLKGRILFTNAVPGEPDAAFTEENDGTPERINGLVKQGYLVRTRTDEGTEAARTNNTTRRDLALATGAQMISTDYPPSEPSQWTPYVVKLPEGLTARCNPLIAPKGCDDHLLEPGNMIR